MVKSWLIFFERVHNLGEGKAVLATDTKRLDFGENRGAQSEI